MSEAELRAMVREVLREAVASRKVVAPGGASAGPALNGVRGPGAAVSALPPANGAAAPAVEPVAITSDADLVAFVRRLTALLDDPATGAAVRAGRHRFTLIGGRAAPSAPTPAPAAPAAVVLSGAVTEAKIAANAKAGTIVLAPGAVVTPLARDKARALGLKLEARR
jgi:hypothetical protein